MSNRKIWVNGEVITADELNRIEEKLDEKASGGGNLVGIELTQAEYDTLPEEEKNNGLYFITDGVYGESNSFKLVDTIVYTGAFASTVTTNRPTTRYFATNVKTISPNAFAILEHTVNKDWVIMNIVAIDRVEGGVWVNLYNYYSGELSGSVSIRIYDIG